MAAAATGSSDVQGKKARERVMIVQHRRSMEAVTGFLLAAAIAIGLTLPDQAWGQASVTVEAAESRHAGEFMVPVDKSQVLRLDVAFADLLVGNAEVADVLALTDRSKIGRAHV